MRSWWRAALCGLGLAGIWGMARGVPPTIGGEQGQDARRTSPPGRERPPMPPIARPVMFNTPEADRILAALQVFPPDNPWNTDISQRPRHPNSQRLVASVGEEKRL